MYASTKRRRPLAKRMTATTIPGMTPGRSMERPKRIPTMLSTVWVMRSRFSTGGIATGRAGRLRTACIMGNARSASGSPFGDACRTYMDYAMGRMDVAEWYLQKYCAASGLSRDEILAWLPVMAGSIYGYLSEEWKKQIRWMF